MGRLARILRTYGPAIAWAALIFSASTEGLSAPHTSRFIVPLLHWLLPRADMETVELLHILIRKTAHVVEYFVLSLLVLRAVRAGRPGWQWRWALTAALVAAGYSAIDEFHQWLVPNRGASGWDSLLDTSGALAAQVASWLWARSRFRGTAWSGDKNLEHAPVKTRHE